MTIRDRFIEEIAQTLARYNEWELTEEEINKCWSLRADKAFREFLYNHHKAIARAQNTKAITMMLEMLVDKFVEPVINLYIHSGEEQKYAFDLWHQVKNQLEVKDGSE